MTLQLLFTLLIFSFWILLFFKDEIFFFKNLPGEWNLQSQHLLSVLWFSSFASSHRSGFRPIQLFCLFFKQKNEWFWWLNSWNFFSSNLCFWVLMVSKASSYLHTFVNNNFLVYSSFGGDFVFLIFTTNKENSFSFLFFKSAIS